VVAVTIDKIGSVGPFLTIGTLAPTVTLGTIPTTEVAATIDKIVNRVQFVTIDTIGSLNRSRHNRNPWRGGGVCGVSLTHYKYTRAGAKVKRNPQSFQTFLL
jgi:hypothetical protein